MYLKVGMPVRFTDTGEYIGKIFEIEENLDGYAVGFPYKVYDDEGYLVGWYDWRMIEPFRWWAT